MKAIIKKQRTQGLWMEDVPEPELGANDLLIKPIKTSICGTDIHLYLWDEWAQKTLPVPCIIGHEFVGRVVKVGSNVEGFKSGDRVCAEGHITCGQCRMCRTGRRVLCPYTIGLGVNRNGCFAEYVALPAENAFCVPNLISDNEACIFDPLGNAVHTALSFDLVGQNVLITGAGPIGLMAAAIAKKAGAKTTVITDLNSHRLSLAKKMGVTRAVNIQEESIKSVMQSLDIEEGFDICLEMSGSAKAFASLTDLLAHGAHLVLLGILPSDAHFDWHQVIFKMLTIKGIYGREIFRSWYQVVSLIQSGLNISPVITHRFRAEEFQKGFETMLSGQCGKVILEWDS